MDEPAPSAPARRTTPPPLVSVLVPAWNAEAAIAATLESVLDEREVALECVVVDDASTDGTVATVEAFARRDPRVVLLALPSNGGVSNARNRGLELLRGDWITLLDADDRFFPGGIAALVASALRTDALAVVGQQVWSDGTRTWVSRLYDIPDIRQPGRKSVAANPGLVYYASPHGKLFHRSVVEGLRFSGRVNGDQAWVIRALLRAGHRLEVIDDTVYEWVRDGPGRGDTPSITATTRRSARAGVEAVKVASDALASVREEAERLLPEAAARRLTERYFERLVRWDLGVHLREAVRRGDPAMAELIGAIEGFVRAAPAGVAATSPAVARELLEPTLRDRRRVGHRDRDACWSLFSAALEADPALPARARGRSTRIALRVAGSGRSRYRRLAAEGMFRLAAARGRLRRRGASR